MTSHRFDIIACQPDLDSAADLNRLAATLISQHRPALLSGLADTNLAKFLAGCTIRRHTEPRDILRQGEAFGFCFLILHGLVEISVIDERGNRVVAHIAGPGEMVGEVEIFCDRPCAATCTTTTGAILASFTARHVMAHVPPQLLLQNFASIFHDRLTRETQRQSMTMYQDAEDRIRFHLLKMTSTGNPVAQISQATLAALADCSRQTANRTLSQWREDGIVHVTRGAIQVLRRDLLEKASAHGFQSLAG